MSRIRAFAMILAILGLCAGNLTAQDRILRDAAAAATGGTGGVAAGQQVGKGISGIFGKVSAASTKAAAVEGVPKTPVILGDTGEASPEAVQLPDGTANPSKSAAPARPQPIRRTAAPQPSAEPEFLAPAFPSPPVPALTRDDLAGVDTGLERDLLVARLGRPSARVMIPEEGELHELYLFSGGGRHLGTVELRDGAVSAINISRF